MRLIFRIFRKKAQIFIESCEKSKLINYFLCSNEWRVIYGALGYVRDVIYSAFYNILSALSAYDWSQDSLTFQ